jgi:ADP-ribosylglycohydrolase
LKFDNYTDAARTIIKAGGDTDTNCSIVCALFGSKGTIFNDYHIKNVENANNLIILDSQLYCRHNFIYFPG